MSLSDSNIDSLNIFIEILILVCFLKHIVLCIEYYDIDTLAPKPYSYLGRQGRTGDGVQLWGEGGDLAEQVEGGPSALRGGHQQVQQLDHRLVQLWPGGGQRIGLGGPDQDREA